MQISVWRHFRFEKNLIILETVRRIGNLIYCRKLLGSVELSFQNPTIFISMTSFPVSLKPQYLW